MHALQLVFPIVEVWARRRVLGNGGQKKRTEYCVERLSVNVRIWERRQDLCGVAESLYPVSKGAIKDWNSIAAKLHDRTNKDCRKRWSKVCGNVQKGAWSCVEDERLQNAVEQYGQKYVQPKTNRGMPKKKCANGIDQGGLTLPRLWEPAIRSVGNPTNFSSTREYLGGTNDDFRMREALAAFPGSERRPQRMDSWNGPAPDGRCWEIRSKLESYRGERIPSSLYNWYKE